MDSVIYLLNKWDLEFQRGELKDIHEWQGDYWPYKEAQPIRLGSCVSSGEVSSLVVRPGYVTDNCFIQLECVSSLPNVHGVQVSGWGGGGGVGGGWGGVGVTFNKKVSAPIIHILYIWIVITCSFSGYANFLEH